MNFLKLKWPELKSYIDSTKANIHYIESDAAYSVYVINNGFKAECDILKDDGVAHTEFEASYKALGNKKPRDLNKDLRREVSIKKSYIEESKSFTTPDFSDRQTWWFDTTSVVGEILDGDAANQVYTSTRTPTAGWAHDWINWTKIPNNARQEKKAELEIKVYVNDVEQTSGFTIDHAAGQVTFDSALQSGDVVKADYAYANSSKFELVANAGKILHVNFVEIQISVGAGALPNGKAVTFASVYNGPAIPALGIPANFDVVVKEFKYYGARDFLNEATRGSVVEPMMELTQKVNVLPWDYLTGHTLKPVGDASTDLLGKREFNKLICYVEDDVLVPNCEIATGTFYCEIEDL